MLIHKLYRGFIMSNLDSDQKEAVASVIAGYNMFITGGAGTGKSVVINAIRDELVAIGCDVVVLAPTGKAAANVEGATLHSFFHFAPGVLTSDNLSELSKEQGALLEIVDTIVVDEISMVRSDVFHAMDLRLRLANDPNLPFGGKQIVVVGDFYQLPPVVSSVEEKIYLDSTYGGAFAFNTLSWRTAQFLNCELKTVHRQGEDLDFANLLNQFRIGSLDEITMNGLPYAVDPITALNHFAHVPQKPPVDSIVLSPTNNLVDQVNDENLMALPGDEMFSYRAQIRGSFDKRDYPTNVELQLKEGAKVILLNNLKMADGRYVYTNGDTGIIDNIDIMGNIFVRLDKNEYLVKIARHSWEAYEYTLYKENDKISISKEVVGYFIQLPLRLAYAMTIHKSQGLTLEKVNLKLGDVLIQPGMLYVSISRCHKLSGLSFDRELTFNDSVVNLEVCQFHANLALT